MEDVSDRAPADQPDIDDHGPSETELEKIKEEV